LNQHGGQALLQFHAFSPAKLIQPYAVKLIQPYAVTPSSATLHKSDQAFTTPHSRPARATKL
jgi:hypothetical protein